MPSEYGTIDLGNSGPGGGQTFETGDEPKEGYAAAVETTTDIVKAGGPAAVLANTTDSVQNINKAVSKAQQAVTGQNSNPSTPSAAVMPPDEVKALNEKTGAKNPIASSNGLGGSAKAILAVVVGLILVALGGS